MLDVGVGIAGTTRVAAASPFPARPEGAGLPLPQAASVPASVPLPLPGPPVVAKSLRPSTRPVQIMVPS